MKRLTFILPLALTACSGTFESTIDGSLSCRASEEGLRPNSTVSYKCRASATATYVCLNKGDTLPKADNKRTTTRKIQEVITPVSIDKAGFANVSILIPPPLPVDFTCPEGQTPVLACSSYVNLNLYRNESIVAYKITSGKYVKEGFTCD